MSRELLKRVIAECSDEGSRSNITTTLYGMIIEYLDIPESDQSARIAELKAALQLAKDMMIANDLSLPRTFEVIDEALAKAKGEV